MAISVLESSVSLNRYPSCHSTPIIPYILRKLISNKNEVVNVEDQYCEDLTSDDVLMWGNSGSRNYIQKLELCLCDPPIHNQISEL